LPSSSARLSVSSSIPVNVAGTLSHRVKIRGAVIDSNLTMDNHTKSVSKSCFYHIRSLRHIRSSFDDDVAISGHSVVAPGLRKFYFAWLPAEAYSASSTGPECPS